MQSPVLTTQERTRIQDNLAELDLRAKAFAQHARILNATLGGLIEEVSVMGQMAVESFRQQVTMAACTVPGPDDTTIPSINALYASLAQQLVPAIELWKASYNIPG